MSISDQQVVVLRALLARDFDEHRKLYAKLDRDGIRTGYAPLISAAFCLAAEHRFAGSSRADIIEFVADARSRADSARTVIDPAAAERIIHAVTGDEDDITDINPNKRLEIQMTLLGALVADESLDSAGLDEFLAAARKLADQMTG